jgi:hypothetical protein
MAAPDIVDVEHAFIGRKRETVGTDEAVAHERQSTQVRCHAVDAGKL